MLIPRIRYDKLFRAMFEVDTRIYSQQAETPYRIWLRSCNERVFLERQLDEIVRRIAFPNTVKVIDIGCGIGSAAQRLINVFNRQGIAYHYTGIDPYQEQLDVFANTDTVIANKVLLQSSLEGYVPSEQFDLVYAVHCLYYCPNLEEAIRKIISFGKRSIIVHHGRRGIHTVHEAFPQYVKKIGPHVISTYHDVAKTLEGLGVSFSLYEGTAELDITACKDPLNVDGMKLISFFLENTELPHAVFREVSDWMKGYLADVIPHDVGIFLIDER